jgi:hypothetical protein
MIEEKHMPADVGRVEVPRLAGCCHGELLFQASGRVYPGRLEARPG